MCRAVLVAAAILFAACRQDPAGTCATHFDCSVGQECSSGVCVALATDHQVGSRCLRDGDCVAWAACAGQVCTLAAGACTNAADCAGWEECDATHACVMAPGRCATTAECRPWEVCNASFACENGPGYCAFDADCAAWQACLVHACETAPGFCAGEADCQAWQDCGTTDHVCALTPGRCGTGADCASWDVCDATHACAHGPGYCGSISDCATWQECNALHACVAAAGFCATGADCQGWESCNAGHTCETAAGRCATGADCASWQQCDATHACATAPGFCADATGCAAWQDCAADHVCALKPGRCASVADCAAGDRCNASHACEADPCQHLAPACTGTTSGFHVSGATGAIFEGEQVVPSKFYGLFGGQTSTWLSDVSLVEHVMVHANLPRDPAYADSWRFWFSRLWEGVTTGSYAVDHTTRAQMLVDTFGGVYHSATCENRAGSYDVCRLEIGPKIGTSEPELFELTASFSQTCDGYPGVLSGCVHYVLGSELGAFGAPSTIAGSGQTCAVGGGGWLRCWGWFSEQEQAPDLMWPEPVLVQLSMGGGHGCATTATGGAICWGDNAFGQAGDPDLPDVWSPIQVLSSGVSSVWAGGDASFAVLDDGRIQFWGSDVILGHGDVPIDAFTPGQYVAFSGGDDFHCGVTPAGGVQCWGFYDEGQLGDGTTQSSGWKGPVDVLGLSTGVTKLVSQVASSCVLQAGEVKCWGGNASGQLGDGTKTAQSSPVTVPLGGAATDVALASSHACAVVDGGAKCWGANGWGYLGDGSTTERLTPDWVVGLDAGAGVVGVAVTAGNSCALLADGTIWCWGDGIGVGTGLWQTSYVPVKVRW